MDEPWVFSWLVSFRDDGIFGDPLMYGRTVDVPYALIPMAYWFRLVEPSLWMGRLYQFILYFPFCAFLSLAAYHLFNKKTAFFTFMIALGGGAFYRGVHLRHDLPLMVFMAASLASYAYALKQKNTLWRGLAGLLLGLGLYAHYHAVAFGPILFIGLYVPLYLARKRGEYSIPYSHGIAFIIGGLLGASIVLLTNILPNLMAVNESRDWRGPASLLQLGLLYLVYFYFAAYNYLFQQIISLFALVLLFRQRTILDRVLIWLSFLGPLALALIAGGGYSHYIAQISPIIILVMGRGLAKFLDIFSFKSNTFVLMLSVIILSPMIGNSTPIFVLDQKHPIELEDPAAVQWIRENVSKGSTIVGPNWYYFFLHKDYNYYSHLSWEYASASRQASYNNDEALFWNEVGVDVFIVPEPMIEDASKSLISLDYLQSLAYEHFETKSDSTVAETEVSNDHVYVNPASLLTQEGD